VAVVLWCAGPALAANPPEVEASGALNFVWKGDPSRGCQAAGVCGVTGSLQVIASSYDSSTGGPPGIELTDGGAVARVEERRQGTAPAIVCTDIVPVDLMLRITRAANGARQALPNPGDSVQLPSAGSCAGPTASDLLATKLAVHGRVKHGYDLVGRASFGAGPFLVTAISTIRGRFVAQSPSVVSTPPPGGTTRPTGSKSILVEHAEIDYRVASVRGTLRTLFVGLSNPMCLPLGSCGAIGVLSDAVTISRSGPRKFRLELDRRLIFIATRTVKRRVGSRRALADLRSGRMTAYSAGVDVAGRLQADVQAPGVPPCVDRTRSSLTLSSKPVRLVQQFLLEPNYFFTEPFSGGSDPLRSRRPGPSGADITAGGPLAAGRISDHELGVRRLTLVLTRPGRFTGSGYDGRRTGEVVVTLTLLRESGGTKREREPVYTNGWGPTG
jgi:hypothetical protein